jgi:DNA-binding transcriptional LysR family regulator
VAESDRHPPRARARLDELAVLVDVAEAGSLAGAARRLGVPKSTIGRAIRRLEAEVGAPLVRRMAGAETLTAAGRTLVTRAAPHVSALRDATGSIARAEGEAFGHLRITAPVDLAEVVLGPIVAAFLALHPAITVEVEATIRVVDLVGEGFDLALRVATRRLPASSLVAAKLARIHLGLYASPAYLARRGRPRRTEDLEAHDMVMLLGRQGRAIVDLEGPRGNVRVSLHGPVSTNDFLFMREVVIAGTGIGLLPWFRVAADVAAGRLVRVLPDHRLAGTTAYVVHPPFRPIPRKLEAFKRFLAVSAPRLLVEPL